MECFLVNITLIYFEGKREVERLAQFMHHLLHRLFCRSVQWDAETCKVAR